MFHRMPHMVLPIKEAADYIKKAYGLRFSVIGATKLLHRLGFVYKKPKVIPGKADRVKQAEFLKIYRETKKNLGPNDRMYFLDSTHPEHNTKPSYGWILHHPRFKLLFVPSYLPNLNLIERLWRFFHQKVTRNRYFETFEEFRKTSLKFFKNLNLYQNELSSLLTDNFQLLSA